jgi:Flp pilus assembly protein TadB
VEIIFDGILSYIFQVLAILSAVLAYKLFFLDDKTSRKARARYRDLKSALNGQAIVKTDRLPDGIVRAGMVLNSKKNRIEPNGKLSNDFVDHVVGY